MKIRADPKAHQHSRISGGRNTASGSRARARPRRGQQAQDEDPRGAGAEAAGGSQECAQNEGGVEEGERIKRKEMIIIHRWNLSFLKR